MHTEGNKQTNKNLGKHFSLLETRIATYSPVASSPAGSSYYQDTNPVEAKGNIPIKYRRV